MLNLTQIKRQIYAIKSTKKVIEAMRLISISAYPRINKAHNSVVFFRQRLLKILNYLTKINPADDKEDFFIRLHFEDENLSILRKSQYITKVFYMK